MRPLLMLNVEKNIFLLSSILLFFPINTSLAQVVGIPGNHTEQTTKENSSTTRKPSRKDWIRIKSTEVPAPLRITLDKDEYKGWENGRIYRSKFTNVYRIELNRSGKRKVVRFKPDGTPVSD